jgi:hypothetical protein
MGFSISYQMAEQNSNIGNNLRGRKSRCAHVILSNVRMQLGILSNVRMQLAEKHQDVHGIGAMYRFTLLLDHMFFDLLPSGPPQLLSVLHLP